MIYLLPPSRLTREILTCQLVFISFVRLYVVLFQFSSFKVQKKKTEMVDYEMVF